MAKKGKMEMYLVASKAKGSIRGGGCNCASDALDALNGVVGWYIEQACKRAKSNGRKTVRAHDFHVM
ncbi:MAG: hypothetical protein L0216_20810 [Planctomycetales bacterium]|nr:hypothetical protein [Planctomycetales bacterium]